MPSFRLRMQLASQKINIKINKMNKNINSGPKSWKSCQESYKTTSSMIIQNFGKFVNPQPAPVIVQVKNLQYHPQPKSNTINRHYSQEDFKKFVVTHQDYLVQMPTKVQDQYFPQTSPIPYQKNGKKIRSIEKATKLNNPNKLMTKKKNLPENLNIRFHGLKQTSSTQSAENLSNNKPLPAFMKSKVAKNNTNRPNQFFYQRISTPRNNGLKRQNFKIISKLGQGKFGKVFLVKQVYTGIILAMKIIQKKKIIQQNLLQQFIRQLRIQSFLNHPYIISLYGFFSDQTHFYTLMELGCDGQLYQLITNRKILTEQATSFIIKNLLEAITYIHSNKVLHRDMKPQNIVIVMGNVKICDFGWAVNKIHPGDLRTTFCGTPLYLSPQILQGNRYDEKVDLWAIGILAYQLYLGCSPFEINDHTDLFKIATQQVKFPQNRQISIEFKQFIYSMLTKNPNQRLTSSKLLKMDFITKYQQLQTCEQLCK